MQQLHLTFKRFLSCLCLFGCGFLQASSLPPANSNPFLDDLSCFDESFSELNALEQWVQETQATQSDLELAGNPLIRAVLPNENLQASLLGGSDPSHEMLLDIPGFLWGFCCSVVGLFLVFVAIDEPESKRKEGRRAIYGCAVGTLVWLGLYIWAIYVASTSG